MKKLYNVIFPIWLILIIPPIVLLVIPSNFIIDSLVLILSFKILKLNDWFDKYKKSILKVWIIGFLVDILGSLLLLATQFMGNNQFLYDNLVYPLVWNPFESIVALIYILIVVVICAFLIYIINYKFSFKKTDIEEKNKKMISIILALITAPYLFFLPTSYFYTNTTNSLEQYQNSYIGDNSAIGGIISNIYSGKYYIGFSLETNKEPYGIKINYKDDFYVNIYKHLEKDASILFKLVENISYVEFSVNEDVYLFDYEYINNIYDNIKEKSIEDINKRYNSEYFLDFTYLGHINEYDIFDTSTTCGLDKNELFKTNEYRYFVECSSIDSLYLVNNTKKIKLITAINENIINPDELFNTNLKISKEVI